MSRVIRQVVKKDNKPEYWVVYCNTTDILFPFLFESEKAAEIFRNLFDNDQIDLLELKILDDSSRKNEDDVSSCRIKKKIKK